jgi:hypothetical protein
LKRCGDNITVFYLYNRNARNISYALNIEKRSFRPAAPFLDWDFALYALALPRPIREQKSFYPDVLNQICPGLGDIPSTNDPDSAGTKKRILSNARTCRDFMRKQLGDHWEEIGGIYDVDMILETIDGLGDTGDRLAKLVFPFWMYKHWRERFRDALRATTVGDYFESVRDETDFSKGYIRSEAVPYIAIEE